jgi:hypothetical protein
MKKKETYQYTITGSSATETRTERLKAKAIARCKADVKAGEIGTVGVVHFQNADELLDAQVKFVKQEDGSVSEEKFPLEARFPLEAP